MISAADCITSLGCLETTWKRLLAGERGLMSAKDGQEEDICPFPLARVKELDGSFGTLQRLHSLLLKIVKQADALDLHADTGLVVAVTKGAIDDYMNGLKNDYMEEVAIGEGNHCLTPELCSLPEYIAAILGLSGPRWLVSAACASGTIAIISAVQAIEDGKVDSMLVIGIEILSHFIIDGFASLMSISKSGARPFDINRDGLTPGEGAGFVLLSSARLAEKMDMPVLASICGWGVSCDATHITAPRRDARGLITAIRDAFTAMDVSCGGVNAHGTGTVYNDSMEIVAFRELWQDKAPPFFSIKGAIGHTFGAAGVIETALSICSLREGLIPPTSGLLSPEAPFMNVSGEKSFSLSIPLILNCNSGFGGINAAILLGTP